MLVRRWYGDWYKDGEEERVLERVGRTVLYLAAKSVCMRGGPGWDLARRRLGSAHSMGAPGGINVCVESRSSGAGTIEARAMFSRECQVRKGLLAYAHRGMVHPSRALHRSTQFGVLLPHCTRS